MAIVPNQIPVTNSGGSLIGYDNLLTSATIVGDSSDPEKALIPNTWERWKPTATSVTARFQLSSIQDIDYVGIAAHDLAGESVQISTATTVGGALTTVETVNPTTNEAIMVNFTTRNVAEVAISCTYSQQSEIGVICAGVALAMPVALYGGHSPTGLQQQTKYQSNHSESGQFLGRTIKREGLKGSFSWRHIDPDWYRANFQPFVLAARRKPFFIKWRPDKYSDEVAFGHTDKNISPSNMGGGHDLMEVSISMRAHSDI